MKKDHPIRTLTGISQQDLAIILSVSRSQLSMYEIGKRDLPSPVKQLLSDMLLHLQTTPKATKQPDMDGNQSIRHQITRLLLENEYQRLSVERKITAASAKQESLTNLLMLADFLVGAEAGKLIRPRTPKILDGKISGVKRAAIEAELTKHRIRQDLLNIEKVFLESKLEKLGGT